MPLYACFLADNGLNMCGRALLGAMWVEMQFQVQICAVDQVRWATVDLAWCGRVRGGFTIGCGTGAIVGVEQVIYTVFQQWFVCLVGVCQLSVLVMLPCRIC